MISNARRAIWVGLAACLLAGCERADSAPDTVGSTTYSGYYQQGFERSDFYPVDGGAEPYWLIADDEDVWAQIHQHYVPAPGRGGGVTVRLVVEGRLATGGGFGHVGRYAAELTAERILEIEPVTIEAFDAWLSDRREPEQR